MFKPNIGKYRLQRMLTKLTKLPAFNLSFKIQNPDILKIKNILKGILKFHK